MLTLTLNRAWPADSSWRLAAIIPVAAIVMSGCVSIDAGAKRVPVERENVIGTWIGLTTDGVELVRLELAPEGDGALGFQFLDERACVVPLRAWSFTRGQIGLEFGEAPECAQGRRFTAVVFGNILGLTMTGSDWKREVRMRKEAPLLKRWEKLRASMMKESRSTSH